MSPPAELLLEMVWRWDVSGPDDCFISLLALVDLFLFSSTVFVLCWCWWCVVWHGDTWYSVVEYGLIWHGVVLCIVVLYNCVWYGIECYGLVWYGLVYMTWSGLIWYGIVR